MNGRLAQLVEHPLDVRAVMGSSPLASTKKRSNFCLLKVTSFFIQAAGLVYHHDAVVYIISPFGAVSHHASACISLRLDDIPQQVADDIQCIALMICNGKPLICFADSDISLKNELHYGTIHLDKLEFV